MNSPMLLARLTLNKLTAFFFSAVAEEPSNRKMAHKREVCLAKKSKEQCSSEYQIKIISENVTSNNNLVLAKEFINLGIVQIDGTKV